MRSKRKLSERRCELKFYAEDFCSNLTTTDPIVHDMLSIMQWQASLNVQNDSILHKVFQNELHSIKYKIKQQLKIMNSTNRQKVQGKISRLVADYHKINQLFTYCLILSHQHSQVYQQLQKFKEYQANPNNLVNIVQQYLNQQIIFEAIYQNYRETYNVNIFTAQLFRHLLIQNQKNLLKVPEQIQKQSTKQWKCQNYEKLSQKTINFKKLNMINRNYDEIYSGLKKSYIGKVFNLCENNLSRGSKSRDQEIAQKLGSLYKILKKINYGTQGLQDISQICIVEQSQNSFRKLDYIGSSTIQNIKTVNKQFLINTMIQKQENQLVLGVQDEEFSFLKNKIIRVEALTFLNSIIKSLNVISYIYNDLDLDIREPYQYHFENLMDVLQSEFIGKPIYSSKQAQGYTYQGLCLSQDHIVTPNIFQRSNKQILYPSAVRSFYKLIKNVMAIKLSKEYDMLTIFKIMSQQLNGIEQTIVSSYQIVKGRQFICYSLVQQLICLLLKQSNFDRNQKCYSDIYELINYLDREKQKAMIVAQIISEFDSNYSVKEPLKYLIKISHRSQVNNATQNSINLYRAILSQIINVRNGLKLDHHFSLNQIHQNFSLFPSHQQSKQDDGEDKTETKQVVFENIIHKISLASQKYLYLPKLLFFFSLQIQLKVIIFRLQLYWQSQKKDMLFEKKQHLFKQFINKNCANIFQIVQEAQNIVDILQKIDKLQKYIMILNNQVSRFHLIQQTYNVLKKMINLSDLKDHINRLDFEKLRGLSQIISQFNPIQNYYYNTQFVKFAKKLENNIINFSRIKLEEMDDDHPNRFREKACLAQCIYFYHAFYGNLISNQHKNLSLMKKNQKFTPNIYQIKFEQTTKQHYMQCLNSSDIGNITEFYDRIIMISIQNTINNINENENRQQIQKLRQLLKLFPNSQFFTSLEYIQQTFFWKNKAMLTTKYHQIYQLLFFFNNFNTAFYCSNKKKSKKIKQIPLPQDKFHKDHNQSLVIDKLYILKQLSPVIRLNLYRRIQDLLYNVVKNQNLYKNPQKYLQLTIPYLYQTFCQIINDKLSHTDIQKTIGFKFQIKQSPNYYINCLKEIMLQLVDNQVKVTNIQEYCQKQEIQLFDEVKGYEITVKRNMNSKKFKIAEKKHTHYNKKQAIFPFKTDSNAYFLKRIKNKAKIDIIRRTLDIHKDIAQLQIQQKKMTNDIAWETQKLKHNVVQKINQFILMSKMDQQQSYINFKHAVNLETIKGIENVIDEQTEMYMKKQKQYPDKVFITCQDQQQQSHEYSKKGQLLEINVKAICENLKLIKIFWAWKKLRKRTDNTRKQWIAFNNNVKKILNNKALAQDLNEAHKLRKQFLHDDVECEITKQKNKKINKQIQALKIVNLQKKVHQYRSNLISN